MRKGTSVRWTLVLSVATILTLLVFGGVALADDPDGDLQLARNKLAEADALLAQEQAKPAAVVTVTETVTATVTETVTATPPPSPSPPPAGVTLVVSTQANRANPVALEGAVLSGDRFVFTTPDDGVTQVRFWLDNPAKTGTPTRTEGQAPFDFKGGTVSTAAAWNTATVANGAHSITAEVDTASGTATITANFTVSN